jgi:acyl-CoA reductase-like NAD-dependent aldehyde dehydrogenase
MSDLIEETRVFGHLIRGEVTGEGDHPVTNPATGEVFARASVATHDDLEAAIAAAGAAFRSWNQTALASRRALLLRIADIVRDHAAPLARLLTLEQGKPANEARGEIDGGEAILRHYAGTRPGDVEALFREETSEYVRSYSPLGIVAGIIPWNFPFQIMIMKLAPALLTGNVIIVKPAPTTPATTLEFGRLIASEVPAGVVQILGDDGSLGPALASHPHVRKIAFTGSTITGRKVMAAAAPTLKRLTLELGGNDPAIVLDDADPATIASGIFAGMFRNAGQVCGAIKRLYVHDSVYEPLVAELAVLMQTLVVGDGLDPRVTLGPVQNRIQHDKVRALLADAEKTGTVLARVPAPAGDGFFIPPTLVGGLDDTHPLVADEQFGPVVPILRFSDEDDVIARANATSYGLTASGWTSDVARGETLVSRIDAGLRCVNKHNAGSLDLGIPMAKQSGVGWLFGEESIREFLQPHLLYR